MGENHEKTLRFGLRHRETFLPDQRNVRLARAQPEIEGGIPFYIR